MEHHKPQHSTDCILQKEQGPIFRMNHPILMSYEYFLDDSAFIILWKVCGDKPKKEYEEGLAVVVVT
jgi:hypothetical protein